MRPIGKIAIFIAVGGVSAFSYFYLFDAKSVDIKKAAVYSSPSQDDDDGYSQTKNNSTQENSSAAPTTPSMPKDKQKKLTADIESDDPDRRAQAIATLAFAPKKQALPILKKVLGGGEDKDRLLALDALRALALQQGDADGAIRDVLRLTVYDGDDYGIASVQAILEEVEQGLRRGAPNQGS